MELSDVFPLVKDSYMILSYLMYSLVFINRWVVWMAVSMLLDTFTGKDCMKK